MSIMERARARAQFGLAAQMERVNRELKEQAPISDGLAPPLEELQRVLADLKTRRPSAKPYLAAP